MINFFERTKAKMQSVFRTAVYSIKDERGDQTFVAIIVLIVIVVALAGIFREQLEAAANAVFEQLMIFIGRE